MLDELAGNLLVLDPGDLPALAGLHTLCESIATAAMGEQKSMVAHAAQEFAATLERIIRCDEAHPAASLEGICRSIPALQAVLQSGSGVEIAPHAEAAPQAAEPMGNPDVDLSLVAEFVQEGREHLESANVHLLTLEAEPGQADAINAVFRAFHTIKGVAGFLGLAQIQALAHEAENVLDQARKGRLELCGGALDVIFDATDALKQLVDETESSMGQQSPDNVVTLDVIARLRGILKGELPAPPSVAPVTTATDSAPPRLGEILVQSGAISAEKLENALAEQSNNAEHPPLGELLVREQQVPAREIAQALRVQKQSAEAIASAQVREIVKVDAERLDRLVDMIGELVITESMVSQLVIGTGAEDARLTAALGQLDKITRELQEMGTSLRMVPLRPTFQKMARLVRDLAKKSGRAVDFVMAGEETELDKTLVDRLGDPLVHMIRNAVDHGLESNAADRAHAGKSETGRVDLRAYHRGGSIYIEIADDGRGLDRDAILAKGRERGLVKDGETPSDREIYNLIFQPGFSTAKQITDVSGRGVGMDVVRRNIDALRGQIDIQTELGRGSVFSIHLPLTLAIIDGMVVRVGAERFVIPTLSVVRALRPGQRTLTSILGRGEALTVQNELLPLFRLGRLFNIHKAVQDLDQAIVVVVEEEARRTGLLVDELLGQQQIVIKSLGAGVQGAEGVAGGAIMSDGHVGLILDVGGIIKLAQAD